ncbi:MAG: hypothetical protein ACOZBW_05130 [Thermodesulfobacteriota bacterium]
MKLYRRPACFAFMALLSLYIFMAAAFQAAQTVGGPLGRSGICHLHGDMAFSYNGPGSPVKYFLGKAILATASFPPARITSKDNAVHFFGGG